MSNPSENAPNDPVRKSNRRALPFIVGAVLAVGAAFGIQAVTDTKAYAHMKEFAKSEGGHGERHGRHGGHHDITTMSDAEIDAKVSRMVRHAAIEIDATDEQSQKIIALVTAVAKELKPIKAQVHATGAEIHAILLADEIDRERLELLRNARLADAERISRSLANTLADVAEVLTPDQRKTLEQRMGEMHGKRKGWHRG